MKEQNNFDVIIIGGSYAGLSAALALVRSTRNVLIIDSGDPCNKQTPHSHNFITNDGESPAVIAAKARAQVLNYPTVKFFKGQAIAAKKTDEGFSVSLKDGNIFNGKKLILATGVKDNMPDIKGFAECWGISVIHCPYCHGYELRGKKTAIFANGDRAFHLASLVNNLTDHLMILTSDKPDFTEEQVSRLQKHGIEITGELVTEIKHENGHVKNVVFADGSVIEVNAIYAAIPFTQHSDIPVSLGCELTETGHIKVDMFQKTNIKGVFVCGDNSSMMRSLAYAVATGNIAGAMVNHELTEENF